MHTPFEIHFPNGLFCVHQQFLDAHRTVYLTLYLEELHKRGLATTDHTTLLLNCYTKNLDKARLDAFIKVETKKSSPDTLPFDLDTAIRVCRQAGFFEHALYLAKQYKRHQEYFGIQFDDLNDVDAAFAYLRSLPCKAVSVASNFVYVIEEPVLKVLSSQRLARLSHHTSKRCSNGHPNPRLNC